MAGPDDRGNSRPNEGPDGISIRTAADAAFLDVVRVLDAAMLETDADTLRDRIAAGDVLVAVAGAEPAVDSDGRTDVDSDDRAHVDRDGEADAHTDIDGTVVGVAVLEPQEGRIHLTAIAVRRERRGRGIGSALVETAATRGRGNDSARLTAAFDEALREFYEPLGFEIRPDELEEPDRVLGVRHLDRA